jgi:hypothetical protein
MDDEALEAERLDADIEMAALAEAGREASRLRRKGICPHHWLQGMPSSGLWPSKERLQESRKRGCFPDRPTNFEQPPKGHKLCLDCGQHVKHP